MTTPTRLLAPALLASLLLVGCNAPQGATVSDRRQYVQDQTRQTLNRLYREKPEARQKIENAAGYGVFSNVGAQVIFVGAGNGYGLIHNNRTGEDTYMRVAEVDAGFGLGVNDFRVVFVFYDESKIAEFTNGEFEFGAEADASARAGNAGGAAGVSGSLEGGVEVFQFNESGLIAKANVRGTRYYPDDELN